MRPKKDSQVNIHFQMHQVGRLSFHSFHLFGCWATTWNRHVWQMLWERWAVRYIFGRKTKKRTLDRFLVVVTFVGQAGVQMQGFPCTPPHCRLLKWSSILNLKQYCHITIFNIATLPYCNLQYCNMQYCNMPYCKSRHSMHTIYSRTASEFHTETNMPYCQNPETKMNMKDLLS